MPRLLPLLFLSFLPFTHISAQSSSDFARAMLLELGNAEYEGNDVVLLNSPQEKYDALFSSVREAKRYVHLEYFWIGKDSLGQTLTRLLAEKVRQGVEVRMLIDGYANHKSEDSWGQADIDSLNAAGIRAVLFDPFRFPWINHCYHRDHRKIAVIDGLQVYTGGMNIADYYLTGTRRSGKWSDIHACLQGPVVDAYERVFANIWEKETGECLDSLEYHGESAGVVGDNLVVSVVNREPKKHSGRMRQAYAAGIDAARSEVRILNPYPTNVRMVRKALHRALKRGVRVQVLVSASCDVRVTPCLIATEMRKLAKRGAEVYYYMDGFHHGKVMMVDGEFCTVGTANMDGRSFLYDYEINAFVFDVGTTSRLNAIFDDCVKASEPLTLKGYKKRFPLRQRIAGRIFVPLRGLF